MEPGERSGIPKCKDMVVAAEGHHGSHHVSQNVVDVVVAAQPEDPPNSFKNPNFSAQKKPEIEGMGGDNVDVPLPPDIQLFYNDLTFEQVREFKLHSHDDKQGVISSSGMFYACLACTLRFHRGTMEGEGHHPVFKDNPEYIRMEEEYLHCLNDKHQTEGQSEMECHSPRAMSFGGTLDDSEDDGKPPAKKINNLENVKAGSSKRKIDQVLEGTGTLFTDGTGNEEDDDVKQLAKVNKKLGYSFESASGISEMNSGSGPTLPIQPFPPVAAMNQVAVTAAASSKKKIVAASTGNKPGTSKNAVALGKNENKNTLASNSNTRQTTLTQLQYPSPLE